MPTLLLANPRTTPERVAKLQWAHPAVTFVVPASREAVVDLIAEADGLFGAPRNEEFQTAKRLRWIQSPGAGVEWMWRIPRSPTATSS